MSDAFARQLAACRVLPVITPADVATTVRLARALRDGTMPAVEITLRTPGALDCIAAVKAEFPDLLVAAGTIVAADQLLAAGDAGADFCVSPGVTDRLLAAAREQGTTLLPGVASASDVMRGLEHGLSLFKLFPAVPVGGIALLRSLAGPFPQVQFCPTGGLSENNFRDYLALPNVVCCGGSWMVSRELVAAEAWERITALARAAMQS
jgi:2-dehydro-3-deoxyphosphogluconate aldolase/(4S)-4-hydroxy-2-oxoglutarate aldolase